MFRHTIPIGKIFGISIDLDYSWFLLLGLLTWILAVSYYPSEFRYWSSGEYWLMGFLTAILLFVSVLIHELGHSLVAKHLGLFVPRIPPPVFMPDGDPGALSVYDAGPLRTTLEELVDFQRINRREVRLSVGAVNVRTGGLVYFDSRKTMIGPLHVLASGALPPAFAPVEIDGEYYWDGAVVSNTPLWYAVDNLPDVATLVVQVDLFSADGALPKNLDQVVERHKDIMYSSKDRADGDRVPEVRRRRGALRRLLQKLPRYFRSDPDVKALQGMGRSRIDVVRLINRRHSYPGHAKDYEFSRTTIQELWAAGLEDARSIAAHPERLSRANLSDITRVWKLAHA